MSKRTTLRSWAICGGILALAAALRLIFFTGLHGYDDVFYIDRAFHLSQGDLHLPRSHWESRIGLVGPTALAYRAFGVTPFTTNLFPFLCSLASVVAAFVFGRRLFGEPAGLLAALLVALFPMDVIFAGMLFPTEPVVLFCGVGVGAFLLAERERRPAGIFLAGVCFGLAAVVHEASILLLVFYPFYALAVAPPRWSHLLLAAGLVVGLSVDPIVHAVMGSPWARLDTLRHSATAEGASADVAYSGLNLGWVGEPLLRILSERTFGLFPYLVAPLALLGLGRRSEPTVRALAVVLIAGFLWIEYGSVSPLHYAPLLRLPRYLAPLVLPAMWLLGNDLAQRGRTVQVAALGALAVTSVVCLLVDSGGANLAPYQEVKGVLAGAGAERVVVEEPHRFPLLFAEGFHPRYALATLDDAPPRGTVVVVGEGARDRISALPGVEELGHAQVPETIYLRVLGSKPVLGFLRAVRPPARFEEYAARLRRWSLWVYRVP